MGSEKDALEAAGTGDNLNESLQNLPIAAQNAQNAVQNVAKGASSVAKSAAKVGREIHDNGLKEGAKDLAKGAVDQVKNKVSNSTPVNVAKGVGNVGKELHSSGLKQGSKNLAKGAADTIKGKVKNKVNNSAPVRAGRATMELAKMVKEKGAKKAAKNVAKNAGKAAMKAAFKVFIKILSAFLWPAILLAILFVVIFANTPAMILTGIGGGLTKEQVEDSINDTATLITSSIGGFNFFKDIQTITQTAKDWYYEVNYKDNTITVESTGEVVTQEELDRLNAAGDYDGVLTFYTEVTQHYLDLEYEDTVNEILNFANAEKVRLEVFDAFSETTYDVEKTMATVGENPFTDVDYANIIACYSTTDDYATALLSRYKDKMRKADFLKYTAERQSVSYNINIYDEDGNVKDTITKTVLWDEITLIPYSSTEIFDLFGVDPNAIYPKSQSASTELDNADGTSVNEITYEQAYCEYYTTLRNKLEELGYTSGGYSTSAVTYGTVLTAEEIEGYLKGLPEGTSKNRKQLIKVALSVVGRIPYNNTGQRSWPYYGWNPDWGAPSGNAKHPYKGIDCSGFVQWVYRNAWCDENGKNPSKAYLSMYSTETITTSANFDKITKSELKPGDLGTLFEGGSITTGPNKKWNHVGIYMGNGRWVHCSGGSGTVVVSDNYNSFTCFYRFKTNAYGKDNYWKKDTYLPFMYDIIGTMLAGVSEDEMTTIATTLHGEFGSDNGFRACAEAVYHKSKYEKKSMYDTVRMKNYLDAYTKLYVTHEWNPDDKRATSGQLTMLEQVMDGELTHYPNSKYPYPVMYFNTTEVPMTGWRAKGVEAERISSTYSTVIFFYCKGVTYDGYK